MTTSFTLEQAKVGDTLRVKRIADAEVATNAVRLGVSEGELLMVASKIPGGPVVIRRGVVEIALGRDLCKEIEVERS